jgi:hypothetical protein
VIGDGGGLQLLRDIPSKRKVITPSSKSPIIVISSAASSTSTASILSWGSGAASASGLKVIDANTMTPKIIAPRGISMIFLRDCIYVLLTFALQLIVIYHVILPNNHWQSKKVEPRFDGCITIFLKTKTEALRATPRTSVSLKK